MHERKYNKIIIIIPGWVVKAQPTHFIERAVKLERLNRDGSPTKHKFSFYFEHLNLNFIFFFGSNRRQSTNSWQYHRRHSCQNKPIVPKHQPIRHTTISITINEFFKKKKFANSKQTWGSKEMLSGWFLLAAKARRAALTIPDEWCDAGNGSRARRYAMAWWNEHKEGK